MIFVNSLNCCTFAVEKSCLTSKLMYNTEVRTVAKSLPLLRRETHKQLILSYSADFSVILVEKTIFLFIFYDKSLEVSGLFLNFATDSVSPFVWVSGLFTGKGRLRNVIFGVFESRKFELASRRYCNENVHDGCIISFRIRAYCYFL